eukprot:CAMPEP_0198259532 /NCGR_PEP_ID=MMETSP1447-20131203/8692_1 /TAXON_ID=420782 /ORGANISM="Chaetoceros dichaeta, Strain CCMP1751" /LENGTH=261 /DNA_ID=CAMNT_0043946941 /DNA_START=121 /DNA_END=906 /DNA_ORIENTATION=+
MQTSNSSISKHVGLKGKNNEGVKPEIAPEGVSMQRTSTFNKRRSLVIERLHTARVNRPRSPSTRLEKENELKNLRMVSVVNSPPGGRKTQSLSRPVEKQDADETDVSARQVEKKDADETDVSAFANFWQRFVPYVPHTKNGFIDSTQKKGLSSRQIEKDNTNRTNISGSAKFWTKLVPCGTKSKICLTDTPEASFSDDNLVAIAECADGSDQGKTEETNEAIETNEVKETVGERNSYNGSNGLSDIIMPFWSKISVCGKRY